MTTRPAQEWLERQWAEKRAWHSRQRAQSMRSKIAIVIALQRRQQIVNKGKISLGLRPSPMRVWETMP